MIEKTQPEKYGTVMLGILNLSANIHVLKILLDDLKKFQIEGNSDLSGRYGTMLPIAEDIVQGIKVNITDKEPEKRKTETIDLLGILESFAGNTGEFQEDLKNGLVSITDVEGILYFTQNLIDRSWRVVESYKRKM